MKITTNITTFFSQSYSWFRAFLNPFSLTCYRVCACAFRILKDGVVSCCTLPLSLLRTRVDPILHTEEGGEDLTINAEGAHIGGLTEHSSIDSIELPTNFSILSHRVGPICRKEVQGNVTINTQEDFDKFFQLYQGYPLHIEGNLTIAPSINRIELPPNLSIGGNFILDDCVNLVMLPEKLSVKGYLSLKDCKNFTLFPKELSVEGDLSFEGCTNLVELPENLSVKAYLGLAGCSKLTKLPERLFVEGDLNLDGCIHLTQLPEGLFVGGYLQLRGCTQLTCLPTKLHVGITLDLTDCVQFTSLPEGSSIPEGFSVGGDFIFKGCTKLTSLPKWITSLGYSENGLIRKIQLINTALPRATINELKSTEVLGMQFDLSYIGKQHIFADISQAFCHFQRLAQEEATMPLPRLMLSNEESSDVLDFLEMVTKTADYKNAASRHVLAQRLLTIFRLMEKDPSIRKEGLMAIENGIASCFDRTTSAVDTLDLMIHLHHAKDPGITENKLRQLARGFYRLQKVDQAAAEYIRTQSWIDATEVYLTFRLELKNELLLPLSIQAMQSRGCARISRLEVQAIGHRILSEERREDFEDYLNQWEPWQIFQRRKQVKVYEELAFTDQIKVPEEGFFTCCLTEEKTNQPVIYNSQVYDYENWKKVFINTGRDPFTREKMQWENLYRLNLV